MMDDLASFCERGAANLFLVLRQTRLISSSGPGLVPGSISHWTNSLDFRSSAELPLGAGPVVDTSTIVGFSDWGLSEGIVIPMSYTSYALYGFEKTARGGSASVSFSH